MRSGRSHRCAAIAGTGRHPYSSDVFSGYCKVGIDILRYGVDRTVFDDAMDKLYKASQKSGYDSRFFSVDFTRSDHARIAEAFGLKAWTVRDPNELDATMRAAIQHDGPTLVDVIAQPLEESAVPVSRWMG